MWRTGRILRLFSKVFGKTHDEEIKMGGCDQVEISLNAFPWLVVLLANSRYGSIIPFLLYDLRCVMGSAFFLQ